MKMTLHIDEDLLRRVMTVTGVSSKTRAVDLALREIDRRAELVRLAREGLGLSEAELKLAFESYGEAEPELRCAEPDAGYGSKSGSR